MTAVSPERAAYEAGTLPPFITWEEISPELKDEWRLIAQAAIKASPELAEAHATIGELCGLVAEMIGHFSAASVTGGSQLAKWHKRAGLRP